MQKTSKSETICLGFGVLMLALGVLFNEWVLVHLFSADGAVEFSVRMAIWVFDLLMVFAGLLLIRYRDKIHFDIFREGDNSLRTILTTGILLRIIVFIFLQPNNNDPHLEVVEFIANNGVLPASDQLLMSFHPPLYYLLATPFRMLGSAKFVQLFSLLLSLGNLYLLYHLVKTTRLLKNYNAKCHMLLLAALLPQFVIFSSFVSNDSLAFFIGTLVFFQAFRYTDQPTRRNLILLAAVLGAGLLTKGSFIAFVPILVILVGIVELKEDKKLQQRLATIALFCIIAGGLGSYKFIENTINIGRPIFRAEDEKELHYWVAKQQGTYQGLKSIVDANVIKLVQHPYLSERTRHSVPLLLYGTFWYSHIRESNFNATRDYPLTVLPRAIYVFGLVPTALIFLGIGISLWQNRSTVVDYKRSDKDFALRLQQGVVILALLSNTAIVLLWGFKHDAWSFFQGRLLFPSFLSIAFLFGWGVEGACRGRSGVLQLLNVMLFFVYSALACYFIIEIGYHIVHFLG